MPTIAAVSLAVPTLAHLALDLHLFAIYSIPWTMSAILVPEARSIRNLITSLALSVPHAHLGHKRETSVLSSPTGRASHAPAAFLTVPQEDFVERATSTTVPRAKKSTTHVIAHLKTTAAALAPTASTTKSLVLRIARIASTRVQ